MAKYRHKIKCTKITGEKLTYHGKRFATYHKTSRAIKKRKYPVRKHRPEGYYKKDIDPFGKDKAIQKAKMFLAKRGFSVKKLHIKK